MRPAQVVELEFGHRAGSGYLLTGQHVLTAKHIIDPEQSGVTGSVRALAPPNVDSLKLKRSLRPAEWPGHAAWLSTSHDLAIVKIDVETMPSIERPRFGRVPRDVLVSYPCSGTGFPAAAGEYSHQIEAKLTWVLDDQRFNLDIGSALPKDWRAWAGLSGAVIFSNRVPVGVVKTVRAGFNGLLTATPLQHLLEDERFLTFWAGEGFSPPEEQLVTAIELEVDRFPIEEELRGRLEVRLRACEQAEVPFRTYHKLSALLAMRSRFAAICFDSVDPGTAARIERWLLQTVRSQAENERGSGVSVLSLDADPSIASATLIARKEGASLVDERHLLLALLADKSTGTMAEIERVLGQRNMEKIQATAETGRPGRLRLGVSDVPVLQSGDRL
jgi:hypothetical protein